MTSLAQYSLAVIGGVTLALIAISALIVTAGAAHSTIQNRRNHRAQAAAEVRAVALSSLAEETAEAAIANEVERGLEAIRQLLGEASS